MTSDPRPCACGRPGCVLVRRKRECAKDWDRRKFADLDCRDWRKRFVASERKRAERARRRAAALAACGCGLTDDQKASIEPWIVNQQDSRHIASRFGLPLAAIIAWRRQRNAIRLAERDVARAAEKAAQPKPAPTEKPERARSGPTIDDGRLLAALLAHMPPPDQVPGTLGVPVWIGRAA